MRIITDNLLNIMVFYLKRIILISVALFLIFGLVFYASFINAQTTIPTCSDSNNAPSNMTGRGTSGDYYFKLTGTTSGYGWGGGAGTPYTDDSLLSTMAVHSGAVANGATAIVKVTMSAGRSSYTGSTQNGVTTSSYYGSWPASYNISLYQNCAFNKGLEIVKNAIGGDGTFDYSITNKKTSSKLTTTIKTSNNTGLTQIALDPGKYYITESFPPGTSGWELNSSCVGPYQTTATAPATLADNASLGTAVWQNPQNAAEGDDAYATVALDSGASGVSHYLKATDFGFDIPNDAKILGVEVKIKKKASSQVESDVIDNKVSLIKSLIEGGVIEPGGEVEPTNKAHLLGLWPTENTVVKYGSNSDLWGASLTPEDVNSPDFGVAVSVGLVEEDNSIDNSAEANIDSITITVTYATPVTILKDQITTCVFTNSLTKLKIVKNVIGGDGMFKYYFDYYIGPTPSKTTIKTTSGTGSTELVLGPGTYSVTELNQSGWGLDSASCDDETSVNGVNSITNITLSAGQTTTCTFTNGRGKLKIVKNAIGGDGTFNYYIGPTPSVASIETTSGTGSTELVLGSGTYSVTESNQFGWTLDSASCDNGTPDAVIIEAGQTTTCTFTNKSGKLKIVKNTTVSLYLGSFYYNIKSEGEGAEIGKISVLIYRGATGSNQQILAPGTYSVTELNQSGWTLDSASCDKGTPDAVIVEAGQTTTCTFTNSLSDSGTNYLKIVVYAKGGDDTFNFLVFSIGLLPELSERISITTTGGVGSSDLIPVMPVIAPPPWQRFAVFIRHKGTGENSSWELFRNECDSGWQENYNSLGSGISVNPKGITTCYFLYFIPAYLKINAESINADGTFYYTYMLKEFPPGMHFIRGYYSPYPGAYCQLFYCPYRTIPVTTFNGKGSAKIKMVPDLKYYIEEIITDEIIDQSKNDFFHDDYGYGSGTWTFSSASCDNGIPSGSGVKDVIASAEQISNCTFKNTLPKIGYLGITKNTTGGDDVFNFSSGSASLNIKTVEGTGSLSKPLAMHRGSGSISEHFSLLKDWESKSASCNQYQTTPHTPATITKEKYESLPPHNYSSSPAATDDYFKATNFGFKIPNDATINGITVKVDNFSEVFDDSANLVKNGVVRPTTYYSATYTPYTFIPITSYLYGGDLWGETSLAPEDVNSSDFGVAIPVNMFVPSPDINEILANQITMTVTYTTLKSNGGIPPEDKSGEYKAFFGITSDKTITCTFENTYKPYTQTLKITKNTTAKNITRRDGMFNYNSNYPNRVTGTIKTVDGTGSTSIENPPYDSFYLPYTSSNLPYTSYIRESAPSGWSLASASCTSSKTTVPRTSAKIVDDSSMGTAIWQGPEGAIYKDREGSIYRDSVYAKADLNNADTTSHYLKATNFGLDIPGDATITGIQIEIIKKGTRLNGAVIDNKVSLVKNGVIQSVNKADTKIWPTEDRNMYYTIYPADVATKYGGDSDLWGSFLTPENVNSPDFGVAISAKLYQDNSISNSAKAEIDQIKMTVTYTTISTTIRASDKTIACTFTNKYLCAPPPKSPKRIIGKPPLPFKPELPGSELPTR